MYRIFILALLFANPFFSSAQDAPDAVTRWSSKNAGYEFSVLVGGQFNNWSGLNSRLQAGGLSSQGGGMANLGMETAIRLGPVIFGDDIVWLVGPDATGTSFTFYFSTNELATHKWIFSPIVGYGWQTTMVHVSQPNTATSFQGALTGSYSEVEVDHEGDFLDLGMSFKYRFGADKAVRYSPLFKAGYRVGLGNNAWTVAKSDVITDGPRDKAGNFYLEIILGFGQ